MIKNFLDYSFLSKTLEILKAKGLAVLKKSPSSESDWLAVQEKYRYVKGQRGKKLRQEHYRPFFLHLGDEVEIHENVSFLHPDKIILEDRVKINTHVTFIGSGGIRVGRNTLIGPNTFIHSANHDISPSGLAFFEKGYVYKPVYIGDNSLISANVSISAGATIGKGSFLALGCVVPGKKYQDGSHLFGVPASPKQYIQKSELKITPLYDVILLLPPHSDNSESCLYSALAKFLITSLGTLQIGIKTENEDIPPSCKEIILFGPLDWIEKKLKKFPNKTYPLNCGKEIPLWTPFTCPNPLMSSKLEVRLSNKEKFFLPYQTKHTFIPVSRSTDFCLENITTLSLYYSIKSNMKAFDSLSLQDYISWIVFLYLSVEDIAPLKEKIIKIIMASPFSEDFHPIKEALNNAENEDKIREEIKENLKKYVDKEKSLVDNNFKMLLQIILDIKLDNGKTFQRLLKYRMGKQKRVDIISLFGICGYLLKDQDIIDQAFNHLFSHYYIAEIGYFKASIESAAFCYKPLLALFLFLLQAKEKRSLISEKIFHSQTITYSWDVQDLAKENRQIADNHSLLLYQEDTNKHSLINYKTREFSSSFMRNLLLISTPLDVPLGYQYELTATQYNLDHIKMEKVWLHFFKELLHKNNLPFITVSPWPGEKSFACSFRYDVDRPLKSFMVKEIINLQKKLNASCASWYFFFDDKKSGHKKLTLKAYSQEIGFHLIGNECNETIANGGATFHSAPISSYWCGKRTLTKLKDSQVSYAEQLSSQLGLPKPFLNADSSSKMWVLPIHFPLEGAITNKGLEYFDNHLQHFRKLKKEGRHVILASHPDIDQAHLEELLDREDFANAWFASIGDVVDRCQKILSYGNICLFKSNDEYFLYSKNYLSDVKINFILPEYDQQVIVQLNANHPRAIHIPQINNN